MLLDFSASFKSQKYRVGLGLGCGGNIGAQMVGKNDKLASYTQTHIGQLFLSKLLSSGIMGKNHTYMYKLYSKI